MFGVHGLRAGRLVRRGIASRAASRQDDTSPKSFLQFTADAYPAGLLRYLGRRIGTTRGLLVVTYRDDEIASDQPLRILLGDLAGAPSVMRLALSRLSEAAVLGGLLDTLHDPDARPICKGKLAKKTEFGYVQQLCEITEKTTGARGYLLPPTTAPGNPGENQLLPDTLKHADALRLKLKEIALDGGFRRGPTDDALADCQQQPQTIYIAGVREPDSPRTYPQGDRRA